MEKTKNIIQGIPIPRPNDPKVLVSTLTSLVMESENDYYDIIE